MDVVSSNMLGKYQSWNSSVMWITIRCLGLIIICSHIFGCAGMLIPSKEGIVLNACNDEPIEGVKVIVTVTATSPAVVDTHSETLKEVTLLTDKNGFYIMESSVEKPRGLFLTVKRPNVKAEKKGYSYSVLNNSYWKDTYYLVPDTEKNYEYMQKIWNESAGGISYSSHTDYINKTVAADNRFQYFMTYASAFEGAELTAKSARELEFLEYFCLRLRQTFASFTTADHASMQKAWAYDDDGNMKTLAGRRINRCIDPKNLRKPPKFILSESKLNWRFDRFHCGNIEDILGPLVPSPYD